MNCLPRHDTKPGSSIAWLLVVAVLFTTLLPMHFHLHHGDGIAGNGNHSASHQVDLHPVVNAADVDHHQDTHTIETTGNATIKSMAFQLAAIALFLTLILLLPAPARAAALRPADGKIRLPHRYWRTTPPLRAPPCA